jgi:hypothetical protein
MSAQENLGAQWAGHPYEHQIGMVPTDVAARYREYDRTPPQHLVDDIKAHGIKEPLIMTYSKSTGNAMLGEGNHRLAAAQALGMTHVPVRVVRNSGEVGRNSDQSRYPKPVPSPVVPDQFGYVRGDLHPRDIGLETL